MAILIDGVNGWLHSADPGAYQLEDAVYDDEFRRLIDQQNQIGWNQLFMGRFGDEWANMQGNYYATRPDYTPKQRKTGARWQVAIIAVFWDTWYVLWERRNKDIHGADSKQQADIERQDAMRTLRDLYDKRDHYEPSARDLLMKDIAEHTTKSTWQIRNWIAINEPILRASLRRVKKKAISGMRSIRQYFAGV